MIELQLVVNGQARTGAVEARTTLAEFLRERCFLTGTHLGCDEGVCGACTVLLDGEAVRSCLLFALQAEGAGVTTIEGIGGAPGNLSPLQDAFRTEDAVQCGFCTPGMVVTLTAFLAGSPAPEAGEIRTALAGNLCRCTGYQGIVRAVERYAQAVGNGK